MNSKGFTFVEVVSAFSLLMLVSISIIPLLNEVRLYQNELAIERYAVSTLHTELLLLSQQDVPLPITQTDTKFRPLTLTFKHSDDLIVGCALWKNYQLQSKEVCLYADD